MRRAILSVQKQTLQDYEHIIISDHCPFAKLVYADFVNDTRIKFVEVPGDYVYNLGAIAFNLGIELAKSDIICYLLDDDIIYENHLEHHYNFYIENPSYVCYHGKYNIATLIDPYNTAKNICSKNIFELELLVTEAPLNLDVSGLSHAKKLGVKWTPQSKLNESWEDNVFMHDIGIDLLHEAMLQRLCANASSLKIQWGGCHRKNTKGLDQEYYDLLMSKLKEDKTTNSGYVVIDNSPYVYEELKDRLYE